MATHKFARPMPLHDAELYLAQVFRPLLAVHSSRRLYGDALRLRERYVVS